MTPPHWAEYAEAFARRTPPRRASWQSRPQVQSASGSRKESRPTGAARVSHQVAPFSASSSVWLVRLVSSAQGAASKYFDVFCTIRQPWTALGRSSRTPLPVRAAPGEPHGHPPQGGSLPGQQGVAWTWTSPVSSQSALLIRAARHVPHAQPQQGAVAGQPRARATATPAPAGGALPRQQWAAAQATPPPPQEPLGPWSAPTSRRPLRMAQSGLLPPCQTPWSTVGAGGRELHAARTR